MYNIGVQNQDVYNYLNECQRDYLYREGIEYTLIESKNQKVYENVKTIITGKLTAKSLNYYPNLEAVIVHYTGLDGLDIKALTKRNIRIFNTSAHACFVAERALALTLAVMGKVVEFHNGLLKGHWSSRSNDDRVLWSSLYGKKIGIYGYGTIGKAFKELVVPFKGEVGIIRYKDRQYDGVHILNTLSDLAKWCDVLVVTAPLNSVTVDSVNKEVFDDLIGKVLVNIGRGPIINEEALYNSLTCHHLEGFGSDVWYNYPTKAQPNCKPSHYDLATFKQVVMTPHNAGFEKTSRQVRYEDVIKQITQIAKGDYKRQIR